VTLIIGLKCSDGIVMGADGAATLAALGLNTAQQSAKKLHLVRPDRIVGTAGSVGIAQRIVELLKEDFQGYKLGHISSNLRSLIWDKILKKEFEVAESARRIHGQLQSECISCTLVAAPIDGHLELMGFSESASPYHATDDLPFIAIGSGQPTADPFLAFIRRIFWAKNKPSIADGIFAVWWTLHHAIKTSPGGVADPKQITLLEFKSDGKAKKAAARELTDGELKEHEEAVTRAEEYLANFDRQQSTATAAADVPAMPTPPANPT